MSHTKEINKTAEKAKGSLMNLEDNIITQTPIGLFHTHDSYESLSKYLDKYNGEEGKLVWLGASLMYNFMTKVSDHNVGQLQMVREWLESNTDKLDAFPSPDTLAEDSRNLLEKMDLYESDMTEKDKEETGMEVAEAREGKIHG
jgi:hypothetical protein